MGGDGKIEIMRRIWGCFLFLLIGFLWADKVFGMEAPVVLERKQLAVKNQNFNFPPEITPLVLKEPNGQRLYVLSTSWSWLCRSSENILNSSPSSPLVFSPSDCQLVTLPDVYEFIDGQKAEIRVKPQNATLFLDWKRNYDGLFSLHLVGNKLVGVRHNENVNHIYPPSWTASNQSVVFQNTVQIYQNSQCIGVPITGRYIDTQGHVWENGCWSGYDPSGNYRHCWDSFQNFVSLLKIDYPWSPKSTITNPLNDPSIKDIGPIIWPEANYRGCYDGEGHNLRSRSSGFYQPTSFVDNGYLYVFFKRGICPGAARNSLETLEISSAWRFFNKTTGLLDVPSLPDGFTKEKIRDFYDVSTNRKSDCLWENRPFLHTQYFSVAKIKGTPFFIGAEETSNTANNDWQMGLRFSSDLLKWSEPKVLFSANCGEGSSGWGCGEFSYPVFYDSQATTNYEIEPWDFWILGMHATAGGSGYEINAVRLSLNLSYFLRQRYFFLLGWFPSFADGGFRWHINYFLTQGCQADFRNFTQSPNFQEKKKNLSDGEYLALLYKTILSRDPDVGGFNWFLERLQNGTFTRESIIDYLFSSSEAQEKCQHQKPYFDFNNNNLVEEGDVKNFLSFYNQFLPGINLARGDLNFDNKTNAFDFGEVMILK